MSDDRLEHDLVGTTFGDSARTRYLCLRCSTESTGAKPTSPCPGSDAAQGVETGASVPRLCARRADCTRPRGHDGECGPDRAADTELADLRAEVERLEERALGVEQCCPDVCNGGACESCPGCCAGWCVNGHDFSPGDWEDVLDPESRERWWDVARQHNLGIDAALRRAEKAEAERDALQRQVDAVRALHYPFYDDTTDDCVACTDGWPCPTIAALDAVEPADQPAES